MSCAGTFGEMSGECAHSAGVQFSSSQRFQTPARPHIRGWELRRDQTPRDRRRLWQAGEVVDTDRPVPYSVGVPTRTVNRQPSNWIHRMGQKVGLQNVKKQKVLDLRLGRKRLHGGGARAPCTRGEGQAGVAGDRRGGKLVHWVGTRVRMQVCSCRGRTCSLLHGCVFVRGTAIGSTGLQWVVRKRARKTGM